MSVDEAMQNYMDIVTATTVDFVEISGGNYDSMAFLSRSSDVFFVCVAIYTMALLT